MCIGLYVRRNKPYMKSLVLKRKDRFETMKKGSFEPVVNSFELELTVRSNSQPMKTFSGPSCQQTITFAMFVVPRSTMQWQLGSSIGGEMRSANDDNAMGMRRRYK